MHIGFLYFVYDDIRGDMNSPRDINEERKSELELIHEYRHGDRKKAATGLLAMHDGFIRKTAASFKVPSEFDDLYAEGVAALIESIDGFDENNGTKFLTYAGAKIKYAMQEHMASLNAIGGSSSTQRRRYKDGDSSAATALSLSDTDTAYAALLLDDMRAGSAEHTIITEIEAETIRKAAKELPEPEHSVVCLRFGIGEKARTLKEAAKIIGISHEEADLALRHAKRLLKKSLAELA